MSFLSLEILLKRLSLLVSPACKIPGFSIKLCRASICVRLLAREIFVEFSHHESLRLSIWILFLTGKMFRKSFPVFVRGFIDDSPCVQSEIETGHLTNTAQKALPVDLAFSICSPCLFYQSRSVSSKQEVLRYGIWNGCWPSEGSPYLLSFRTLICMLGYIKSFFSLKKPV